MITTMPFTRVRTGKWVSAAATGVGRAAIEGPRRLVIVDTQVDADGTFARSFKPDVKVVTFDSKSNTAAELFSSIRAAHHDNGVPFLSVAFANHGPSDAGMPWTLTNDTQIDLSSVKDAILALAPFVELLTSVLEPTAIGQSHIIFLACKLAHFNHDLVPALEKLYHVDFMASTDITGGVESANWRMETDDFNFAENYCDPVKLKKYRGVMMYLDSGGYAPFQDSGDSGGSESYLDALPTYTTYQGRGRPRRTDYRF